jgi:NAD(P)-dependent dehydrogenase (short-subunit alcohol dehydrogenase family)
MKVAGGDHQYWFDAVDLRRGLRASLCRQQGRYRAIHARLRQVQHTGNAILPGFINTDLTKRLCTEIPGLYDRVLARTLAARWGEIDDVAGIAVFLSSHASDFVIGASIPVDGGYSIMA